MKRLAAAVVILVASLGVRLEAGEPARAASLVDRSRPFNQTHYVRGAGKKLPAAVGLESRDRHRVVHQTHYVRGR